MYRVDRIGTALPEGHVVLGSAAGVGVTDEVHGTPGEGPGGEAPRDGVEWLDVRRLDRGRIEGEERVLVGNAAGGADFSGDGDGAAGRLRRLRLGRGRPVVSQSPSTSEASSATGGRCSGARDDERAGARSKERAPTDVMQTTRLHGHSLRRMHRRLSKPRASGRAVRWPTIQPAIRGLARRRTRHVAECDAESELRSCPRAATRGAPRGTPGALELRMMADDPRRPRRTRPFRILVAEDDAEMRRVVADTLRERRLRRGRAGRRRQTPRGHRGPHEGRSGRRRRRSHRLRHSHAHLHRAADPRGPAPGALAHARHPDDRIRRSGDPEARRGSPRHSLRQAVRHGRPAHRRGEPPAAGAVDGCTPSSATSVRAFDRGSRDRARGSAPPGACCRPRPP